MEGGFGNRDLGYLMNYFPFNAFLLELFVQSAAGVFHCKIMYSDGVRFTKLRGWFFSCENLIAELVSD